MALLNSLEPINTRLVSELPFFIRETREAFNNLNLISSLVTRNVVVQENQILLDIGEEDYELSLLKLENVFITSDGGTSTIERIRKATHGQIKIFIFGDSNISFRSGIKEDGKMFLNQLPETSDFNCLEGDVLALINEGGDGELEYGYWKELWRSLNIR